MTIINAEAAPHVTGEPLETQGDRPVPQSQSIATVPVATLGALDKVSAEVAVSDMLSQAHDWMSNALAATDVPAPVRADAVKGMKAYLSTVQEATRQKDLSKSIQEDATEMVRRAEYMLGRAIREGQEAGEIRSHGDGAGRPKKITAESAVIPGPASPYDFAKHTELYGDGTQGGNGVLAMADNADPEEFEEALAEAREEGNLSRANVVRKVKKIADKSPEKQSQWAEVRRLAEDERWSSRDINARLHIYVRDNDFRKEAKRRGISFPADAVFSNKKHLKSLDIIQRAVTSAAVTAEALGIVSTDDVTPEQAAEWLPELTRGIRALNQLKTQLKEIAR